MEKSVIVFEKEKMMRKGIELLFKDHPTIRIYAYEDFISEKHQIDALNPELIIADYDSFYEVLPNDPKFIEKCLYLTNDPTVIKLVAIERIVKKPLNLIDLKKKILSLLVGKVLN